MSGSRRPIAAAVLAWVAMLAAAAPVLSATPDPTRGVGNDPRSPGEGPGLVGDPLFAIGLVLLIGLIAVVVTVAWIRVTKAP